MGSSIVIRVDILTWGCLLAVLGDGVVHRSPSGQDPTRTSRPPRIHKCGWKLGYGRLGLS